MGLVLLAIIWELASWIVAGSDQMLIFFGLGIVVLAVMIHILNDWRSGVLLFLLWILFEDLARKYLGNSMTVYFAKDFLVGVAYLSFYMAKRRREVDNFRPPFLVPLGLFFALAVVQVFNTYSTSILYGLLGLKLYFYYAPLMLLGYAMLRRPQDLDRLLQVSLIAGAVIAGLGIAQSVLGVTFLSPEVAGSEIYELSHVIQILPGNPEGGTGDEFRLRQRRSLLVLFGHDLDSRHGRRRLSSPREEVERQVWSSGYGSRYRRRHGLGNSHPIRLRAWQRLCDDSRLSLGRALAVGPGPSLGQGAPPGLLDWRYQFDPHG